MKLNLRKKNKQDSISKKEIILTKKEYDKYIAQAFEKTIKEVGEAFAKKNKGEKRDRELFAVIQMHTMLSNTIFSNYLEKSLFGEEENNNEN